MKWKKIIVVILLILIVLLFILSWIGILPEIWKINISDVIEFLVLIGISYYLVAKDNEESRKKDGVHKLIVKIQDQLTDFADIKVEDDRNKKITRIKLKVISNYIEILKQELKDDKNVELIIHDIDNLSGIVLDHIDDIDYINKSYAEIYRLITDIITILEKISFQIV